MTTPGLLAVLAHPDDESFRPGGTLARLSRLGVRVWVLCATRGEAGVPGLDPAQVGRIREAELQCACRALGIEPPRFLGYEDGTLAEVNEIEAGARVTAAVRELRPAGLLTWPPDGVSGHPDHMTVSRWADQAFLHAADPDAYPQHESRQLEPHKVDALYHIVMPHSLAQKLGMNHLRTVPDEMVTLAVDVSEVWEAKMAAIHCHGSQASATPILSAPLEMQRLFLSTEYFRLAASRSIWSGEPQVDVLGSLGMRANWQQEGSA